MTLLGPYTYPTNSLQRDAWIQKQRSDKKLNDAYVPYEFFVEEERSIDGFIEPVATVFLTNRECRFHCVMCDLWRNTLSQTVPIGAIPAQLDYAISKLAPAKQIKLYNSSSFFDRLAIPFEDYPAIADCINNFQRVIVESHPAFIGDSVLRFRDMLRSPLEIGVGLETAHPEALSKLNKRITIEQFRRTAHKLKINQIGLRVFILVQPPFIASCESLFWAERSLDLTFECGATVATLIATRSGNGAMETLARLGQFLPPTLKLVEDAMAYGLNLRKGRVFVDLWNLRQSCPGCFDHRKVRLHKMNLQQSVLDKVTCTICNGES